MPPPPDAHLREQALDTSQSFLVQAPAGSGKTELLTQRFLALLATVDAPESIVAITFTRKAAGEMRTRISGALSKAAGPRPAEPHAQRTWELASAALARNAAQNWGLLDNPGRLRITTIDSTRGARSSTPSGQNFSPAAPTSTPRKTANPAPAATSTRSAVSTTSQTSPIPIVRL